MRSYDVKPMSLEGPIKRDDMPVYCILKVGAKYYSGLSPSGRATTVSSPAGACILEYEDATEVVDMLGQGTILQIEFKDVAPNQSTTAGVVEQFIGYAQQYGYTVPYTMASYAVAACGIDFEACLAWTDNLNKAILPAVRAVCDKVSAKPEDAYEQLLVDGPTDSAGFMSRVNTAVVALWGVRR